MNTLTRRIQYPGTSPLQAIAVYNFGKTMMSIAAHGWEDRTSRLTENQVEVGRPDITARRPPVWPTTYLGRLVLQRRSHIAMASLPGLGSPQSLVGVEKKERWAPLGLIRRVAATVSQKKQPVGDRKTRPLPPRKSPSLQTTFRQPNRTCRRPRSPRLRKQLNQSLQWPC